MNVKRVEVIKLIGICSANYRNWPEEGKEEAVTMLWLKMLEDTPFFIAEAAIEKYIAESTYPPTIADIRARIADITVFREKTPIEAWGDVCQAIRRFGHPRPKEAMLSLTPITQKVVESIGYMTLCRSENEMADRAHFLKVYEVLAKRERDDALMLQSTKDTMYRIQNGETEIDNMRRIKQINN
jgi:hypothetical protein